MAQIQSGIDTTLATVDTKTKALQVITKGTNEIDFSQTGFALDSFERLRVSEPRIAFEYSFGAFIPSSATTIWESTAVASGTLTSTTNLYGTDLNTLTASGSGYWLQSYNHVRYAPGVSTTLRFTFNFNSLITNIRSRVGLFTDQGTFPSTAGDGVFIEADGSTISFVRRSMATGAGGSEERITQNNWNLNKMNGTGDVSDSTKNILTLDWTLTQHLIIEYQWLGVGVIRFGFETGYNGIVWCHEIISVNNLSIPWCRTGSLPIRAECYATGTASLAGRLTLINCVVLQEGDVLNNRGWRYFGGNSGATAKVGGTATGLYPILSLRAASTNDLTKRAKIVPVSIDIVVSTVATGATSLQVQLLTLPTPLTGATFAVTTAGSVVTIDIAATATTAVTGTSIFSKVIPNVVGLYSFPLSDFVDNLNIIGYNAAGTVAITGSSILCLALGTLTGTATVAATVSASINWKELV